MKRILGRVQIPENSYQAFFAANCQHRLAKLKNKMKNPTTYVCSKCKKLLPFDSQNFCCFCGNKVLKTDLNELPICPKSIKHGHCDDCLKLKAKLCDNCHSDKEVKFCVEYDYKCLCYNCRMNEATVASLQRSY